MDFVTLRGGLVIRNDARTLLADLTMRGHVLSEKDGALLVSNGSALTAADRAAIREMKAHLLALVLYVAPEPEWT